MSTRAVIVVAVITGLILGVAGARSGHAAGTTGVTAPSGLRPIAIAAR